MTNPNARLEAFSDGVFAIALTLLIIEIKVPNLANIHTSAELWQALHHILPSIYAFILSFGIILITWVNHHHVLKLVDKSSPPFIYANGFLLLTIVIVPFPTALLGETIFTDHASPAVLLYSAVYSIQAIGWSLIARTSLKTGKLLTKNDKSTTTMKKMMKDSYFAFMIYGLCAIIALWFPLTIAVIITALWIFWLIYGINLKDE